MAWRRRPSIWKGALAGLAGGLAASWTMDQFQAAWQKLAKQNSRHPAQQEPQKQQQEREPATVKAAEAISRAFGHELTPEEKKCAGTAVHYAFGVGMGALYGGLAEVEPHTGAALGLPFGGALWFVADEVAVPALGLAGTPLDYPLETHAQALASHFVYGLTTDLVRRAVRKALNS